MAPHATFFDGESAARRGVALDFSTAHLRIAGEGVEAIWRYEDIGYATARATSLPITFLHRAGPSAAARLIVDDRLTADMLIARCPDLTDRAGRRRGWWRGLLWGSAGVAAFAVALFGLVQALPGVVAPLIPVAWEKAVGDQMVADIASFFGAIGRGQAKRCDDPGGRAALDALTRRLTNGIDLPYQLRVDVLDVGVVNALAVPGGRIVVFKALLASARSPDEVAGVIAHEMGHVIARHPTQGLVREMGLSLVFNLALGGFGKGTASSLAHVAVSSAYSRDAEREADDIGLHLLGAASISPAGIASFFDRLAARERGSDHSLAFLASHPQSAERAAAAHATANAHTTPALSPLQWKALSAICAKES